MSDFAKTWDEEQDEYRAEMAELARELDGHEDGTLDECISGRMEQVITKARKLPGDDWKSLMAKVAELWLYEEGVNGRFVFERLMAIAEDS